MLVAVFYFLRRLIFLPLLLSRTTQLRIITGFICAVIFLWACTMSWVGTCLFLLIIAGRALYELSFTKSSISIPTVIIICATFILHMSVVIFQEDKQLLLLTSYIASLHDCGGYIAGNLFGKYKIAPTLSPKKTFEGFLGSFLFIGVGILLFPVMLYYHFDYEWYDIPVLTILSLWGDLLFSKIKRDSAIKDYSNILPGHGGILDRIDSTILITWYLFFIRMR